jgi:ABC-type nitrate/sulfonate/bicarbonate transport system permease component
VRRIDEESRFEGIAHIWEICVRALSVPLYVLPAPSDIVEALAENFALIWSHTLITLLEATLGMVIAALLGILLAVAMDAWPSFRRAIHPLLVISQAVPIIVLAPLFIIYLGFGLSPKIVTVVLMCFFPIAVSFADGLGDVPQEMINLMRTMGASRWQIYRIAKLPGAVTSLFSGLGVAAVYSIMGAVVGEWLGAEGGLGFYMLRVKNAYMLDKVFATVLMVVLLSLAMASAVKLIKYFSAPWTRRAKRGT